jgi:hypothetical protein
MCTLGNEFVMWSVSQSVTDNAVLLLELIYLENDTKEKKIRVLFTFNVNLFKNVSPFFFCCFLVRQTIAEFCSFSLLI